MQQRKQHGTDTVILAGRLLVKCARRAAALTSRSSKARSTERRARAAVTSRRWLSRFARTLADENVSNMGVSRLIGSDPALAARILKTANSATVLSRQTSRLRACMRPWRRLRCSAWCATLVVVRRTAGIHRLRQPTSAQLSSRAIWQHSVHSAALAHMLARVGVRELNPDDAFLAGLLHEVGKLYILMRARERTDLLSAGRRVPRRCSTAWHPRVGRAVIEAWDLPAELAAAVGDHQSCPPSKRGSRPR